MPTDILRAIAPRLGFATVSRAANPLMYSRDCGAIADIDATLATFPVLAFTYRGVTVNITWEEYAILSINPSTRRVECELLMEGWDNENYRGEGGQRAPFMLTGNAFLRRFHTIFDATGKRVGLGLAVRRYTDEYDGEGVRNAAPSDVNLTTTIPATPGGLNLSLFSSCPG